MRIIDSKTGKSIERPLDKGLRGELAAKISTMIGARYTPASNRRKREFQRGAA